MEILQIEVGEDQEVVTTEDVFEYAKTFIGGYIKPIQLNHNIFLWVDEEAYLSNPEPNVVLCRNDGKDGKSVVLVGNVVFTSMNSQGDLIGLSKEQILYIRNNLKESELMGDNRQPIEVFKLDVN